MAVTEFTATLYFKNLPKFTEKLLEQAWGSEGYTCERSKGFDPEEDFFAGFRGETYVRLSHPLAIKKKKAPQHYPSLLPVNIDYDETFLVNPNRAYECFLEANYQVELQFRVIKNIDEPKIAHNEWVAVLLGIFQVFTIDALWFRELGVLIGKEDLEEFTDYANSQDSGSQQFSPSLAFGTFVSQHGNIITAWSSGLEHFSHKNIFLESERITPMDALRVIFNAGYMVTSEHHYENGETMQVGNVFCKIEAGTLLGEEALRFIPVEA
jgi:hypothetical protein